MHLAYLVVTSVVAAMAAFSGLGKMRAAIRRSCT